MADDQETKQELVAFPGTVVQLYPIATIVTYQVMESDLDHLDQYASDENQSLGFMTGSGGAFVGLLAALASASGVSPTRTATLVALTAVAGLAMLWSGVSWLRVRKKRPSLLAKIRAGARLQPMGHLPPGPPVP